MQATVQELEVWYLLPAVRKELAKIMKEKGLTQAKIAKLLGITEAAVSQYIKSKRAKDVHFDVHMKKILELSAQNLIKGKSQRTEIQRVLKYAESHHVVCTLCPDSTGKCKECFS
jgi:predicted transcriptional regulator